MRRRRRRRRATLMVETMSLIIDLDKQRCLCVKGAAD